LLADRANDVTALVRRRGTTASGVREWCHATPSFQGLDDAWPDDFAPDCVVHLAARVHVMKDEAPDPWAAFYETNVAGTLRVARAAIAHGARRLIFVSSIKAIAESDAGVPLTESTPPAPADPYGRSKLAAEEALWRLSDETGLEVVVVRPPLVYGPDVGANFLQMLDALWRGVPLPLGAIDARRSLVYTENLADALMLCATDARAANRCFHVCDGDDLSVADLLRSLGQYLSKPARLMPVPPRLLRLAGALTGRAAQMDRLTGSLRIDASRIRSELDWHPPFRVQEGLEATARWYRATH
jgi:UDP-glucose 4-epimerase